jgi:hypothetical protein
VRLSKRGGFVGRINWRNFFTTCLLCTQFCTCPFGCSIEMQRFDANFCSICNATHSDNIAPANPGGSGLRVYFASFSLALIVHNNMVAFPNAAHHMLRLNPLCSQKTSHLFIPSVAVRRCGMRLAVFAWRLSLVIRCEELTTFSLLDGFKADVLT